MSIKLNLPNNSSTNDNFTAEANYMKTLYDTKPRSQSGNVSYVSLTSGVTYQTLGSLYENQGQEGLLAVISNALESYIPSAEEFNAKVETSDFDSHVSTYNAHIVNYNQHIIKDSSETVKGHVELATAIETTAGTDSTKAVHPAGLKVELDKKLNIEDYSQIDPNNGRYKQIYGFNGAETYSSTILDTSNVANLSTSGIGTTATLTAPTSTYAGLDRAFGVKIHVNNALWGVIANLSSFNSGYSRLHVWSSAKTVLYTMDISTVSTGTPFYVQYPFQANTDYYIVVDNNISIWNIAQNTTTSAFPYTSTDINLTGGLYYGTTDNTTVYVFTSIQAQLPALTGTITKTISPSLLKKWGNAKWTQTVPTNTTVVCDILSSANVVLKSNITSIADISDLSISTYTSLKIKWTLTRVAITDTSPTVSVPSITWEGDIIVLPQRYTPSDVVLLSAPAERGASTSSLPGTIVKSFKTVYSGMFRIKGQIKTSNPSYAVSLMVTDINGTSIGGTASTYSSSYINFSVDTTVEMSAGSTICVRIYNTTVATYISNATLCGTLTNAINTVVQN